MPWRCEIFPNFVAVVDVTLCTILAVAVAVAQQVATLCGEHAPSNPVQCTHAWLILATAWLNRLPHAPAMQSSASTSSAMRPSASPPVHCTHASFLAIQHHPTCSHRPCCVRHDHPRRAVGATLCGDTHTRAKGRSLVALEMHNLPQLRSGVRSVDMQLARCPGVRGPVVVVCTPSLVC